MTVYINGRSAVHPGSGGTLNTVDFCKNHEGIPLPYSNTAKTEDLQNCAQGVFINGQPMAHKKSYISKSHGDEGGVGGGVRSGTTGGKAEFITASPNVFVNGFAAVRQGDLMVSNNRNTAPAPLQQPGGAPPPALAAELERLRNLQPTDYVHDIDVIAGAHIDIPYKLIAYCDNNGVQAELGQVYDATNSDAQRRRILLEHTTATEQLALRQADYFEDSYENLRDNARDYVGRISKPQRRALETASTRLKRSDGAWLEEQAQWFGQLETLLQREAGWQDRVRKAVANRPDNAPEVYRELLEHNTRVIQEALVELHASLTPEQQAHLERKLGELRDDIAELSNV